MAQNYRKRVTDFIKEAHGNPILTNDTYQVNQREILKQAALKRTFDSSRSSDACSGQKRKIGFRFTDTPAERKQHRLLETQYLDLNPN